MQGLKKVGTLLSLMQVTRIELLGGDTQDILLGQLLGEGHNVIGNRFTKITLLKVGPKRRRGKKC